MVELYSRGPKIVVDSKLSNFYTKHFCVKVESIHIFLQVSITPISLSLEATTCFLNFLNFLSFLNIEKFSCI